MSDPRHWYVSGDDEYAPGCPIIEISSGEEGTQSYRPIAWAIADVDIGLTDEDRDIAALIAAAPDLLAMVTAYVDFIKCRREFHGDISSEMEELNGQARAAIAKAGGAA